MRRKPKGPTARARATKARLDAKVAREIRAIALILADPRHARGIAMGEKQPQPTDVLIKRLRRVAKYLDRLAETSADKPSTTARANTCWQAAARLEEFCRVRDRSLPEVE